MRLKLYRAPFSISNNKIRVSSYIESFPLIHKLSFVLFYLSIWTCTTDRILPEYDLKEFEWKREEYNVSGMWMDDPP